MEDMVLYKSSIRTAEMLPNYANAQKASFTPESKKRPHARRLHRPSAGKAPAVVDREAEALYRGSYTYLWDGHVAQGAAGRSDSGCGVVPGTRLGALTSKAGMSFSIMGFVLATARSIKDSDCARAVDRLRVPVQRPSTLQRQVRATLGEDGSQRAGSIAMSARGKVRWNKGRMKDAYGARKSSRHRPLHES
jgi:hypothetical protein